MKIYHYDPKTKILVGTSLADPDPLEIGNWLIPAHATPIEPPIINPNQFARFDIDMWRLEQIPEEIPVQENEESSIPTVVKITSVDYLERFTEEEQIAIVTATMSNPVVKLWYDKMMASGEVLLSNPQVLENMNMLVSENLIDSSRINEILNT